MAEHWKTMRLSEKAGPPLPGEFAPPPPGPGEVLVRLRAAALNFADLLMQEGSYQETPSLPFIPGLEGAGEVLAAGPGVALRPGTRVAVHAQGTMAEANVFPADRCVPIPERMSWEEAAGFLIAYGTSHLALVHRGGLRAGETVAVLGAAGGVGLTAVEIAAALGARVIAVARGAARLATAQAAGASHAIDSAARPDLKAALRALGGVDMVYDPVGAAPGEAAFGALRPGGRHLVIGFAGGGPPHLPLNHALVKNIAIHGIFWGGYRKLDPVALDRSISELMDLYRAGRLHPHVGATLPLDRLEDAYRMLRERRTTGKIVITI